MNIDLSTHTLCSFFFFVFFLFFLGGGLASQCLQHKSFVPMRDRADDSRVLVSTVRGNAKNLCNILKQLFKT